MTETTSSPFAGPIEVDEGTGTYRVRYDWSSGIELTVALVEFLGEVRAVDPRDVDRLARVVDTESLNRLFEPTAGADRSSAHIGFEIDGHRVTVEGTGDIEVRPPNSA